MYIYMYMYMYMYMYVHYVIVTVQILDTCIHVQVHTWVHKHNTSNMLKAHDLQL